MELERFGGGSEGGGEEGGAAAEVGDGAESGAAVAREGVEMWIR